MYLLRLDDASKHMNIENWVRMKNLLDQYGIKPIYGIIPNNQDPELLQYAPIDNFWQMMEEWESEGWIPAMHGYTHIYETEEGGINPVNKRSEFAGVPLERQREKIRAGYKMLKDNGIQPEIFFAPAHTFDVNTLKALYQETPIRIISDTIAGDVYYRKRFYFIPQQSGRARKMPLRMVTFCYHPNTMGEKDFEKLQGFFARNSIKFGRFSPKILEKRRRDAFDEMLSRIYFIRRKL